MFGPYRHLPKSLSLPLQTSSVSFVFQSQLQSILNLCIIWRQLRRAAECRQCILHPAHGPLTQTQIEERFHVLRIEIGGKPKVIEGLVRLIGFRQHQTQIVMRFWQPGIDLQRFLKLRLGQIVLSAL